MHHYLIAVALMTGTHAFLFLTSVTVAANITELDCTFGTKMPLSPSSAVTVICTGNPLALCTTLVPRKLSSFYL
ncbi:hypothetical protein PI125_g19328 [Phytophthora idaei]|nr:hypothetical protein PI125_g19328 [Phytophthora idaei]